MKLRIFYRLLWIGGLFLTGCSSQPKTASTLFSILTPESTPSFSSIFPYTGKIAFTSFDKNGTNNHIYVMNADGCELIDIAPNLSEIRDLAWSPDGNYLAFDALVDSEAKIFTIKTDGSELKQLSVGTSPSWSPHGTHMVFSSSDSDILDDRGIVSLQAIESSQIYIINSDGTGRRRLITNTVATMNGSYRNDGFISVSEPITRQAYKNYIVDMDGNIQEQFPDSITNIIPTWSPDNKFVLLASINKNCTGFFVMRADSTESVCLNIDNASTSPVYVSYGHWSPDGQYIIFSSNLDGDWDIYVMKSDGSDLTQLTNFPGDENSAVWSSVQ